MKKLNRMLAFAICIILGVSVLTGCDSKKEVEKLEKAETEAQAIKVDGKAIDKQIVLMDFENYNPNFQLSVVNKTFGKLSQNSDKKYVKSGNFSAKIEALGGYSSHTFPEFYYPLRSDMADFNYTDIRNWECVSMWIYNAQDVQREVTISLVTDIYGTTSYTTAGEMNCYLKPGWNDIVYFPDTDMLNIVNDVENVRGICFRFQNAGVKKLEEAPVFYLDEVTLNLNDNYKECKNVVEFDKDEENGVYEIIGFDKPFHAQGYDFRIENPETTPDVEIVEAADEGIKATEGSMVLKLTMHPGTTHMATWQHFIIPEKIVRESGFMNIPAEERNQYRFAFDMYSANSGMGFVPLFYTTGNMVEYKPVRSFSLKQGEWVTQTFDFSIFSSDHIGDPGNIRFSWAEYPQERGDLVVYFDNFRYEKIK